MAKAKQTKGRRSNGRFKKGHKFNHVHKTRRTRTTVHKGRRRKRKTTGRKKRR